MRAAYAESLNSDNPLTGLVIGDRPEPAVARALEQAEAQQAKSANPQPANLQHANPQHARPQPPAHAMPAAQQQQQGHAPQPPAHGQSQQKPPAHAMPAAGQPDPANPDVGMQVTPSWELLNAAARFRAALTATGTPVVVPSTALSLLL